MDMVDQTASAVYGAQQTTGRARSSVCRFCGNGLRYSFVDLGMSPLCESYLRADQLNQMEPFFPLHVYVCERCFLVQLQEYVRVEEIFTEYAYFSSYADSWVEHARQYADLMIERFRLNGQSHVVEIASNDGYLLQHFVAKGIRALGIEPAANVAKEAEKKGVPTIVEFFGEDFAHKLADDGQQADVITANNVLAQVPDLNAFLGLCDHISTIVYYIVASLNADSLPISSVRRVPPVQTSVGTCGLRHPGRGR